LAVAALAPNTLSRVGATATLALTGAAAISRAFTLTAALPTGCAPAKARCGTAVTAPCTFRFTYVTFVMFVVRLTMVVLYTFVIWTLLTVVLLMLTRFTYSRLTWYDGT
jgi:hypothetical protein